MRLAKNERLNTSAVEGMRGRPTACLFTVVLLAAGTLSGPANIRAASADLNNAWESIHPWIIRWTNGESITAADLKLTDGMIEFHCAFGRRRLPVDRVREIALSGDRPVFAHERFFAMDGSWQRNGRVELDSATRFSLPASAAVFGGGSMQRSLARGCALGSLSLAFREPPAVNGGFELRINTRAAEANSRGAREKKSATGNDVRTLRIVGNAASGPIELLDAPPGWQTTRIARFRAAGVADGNASAKSAGESTPPGWRRLAVGFSPDRTVISIDNQVLGEGPLPKNSELAGVAIECPAGPDHGDAPSLWIDDLVVLGSPVVVQRYLRVVDQTDALHNNGDQTFGTLLQMDGFGATLTTASGLSAMIPWPQVHSILFPLTGKPPSLAADEGARWGVLETPSGRLAGWVEGERPSAMLHPLLGRIDLTPEHAKQAAIRPMRRRQEIWLGIRHLGTKIVGDFRDPKPSGTELRAACRLEKVPAAANVVLWVAGMEGTGPKARFAEKLKNGALQTVLYVNGQRIGALNDQIVDASRTLAELRLATPASVWKVGENVIELKQTPDPASGNFDECEAADLSLEIIDERTS